MKRYFQPKFTNEDRKVKGRSSCVLSLQTQLREILGSEVNTSKIDYLLKTSNYSVESAVSLYFNTMISSSTIQEDSLSESSLGSSQSSSKSSSSMLVSNSIEQSEPDSSSRKNKHQVQQHSNNTLSKPNAFDIMLTTARAPPRVEEFSLILDEAGKLSWTWHVGVGNSRSTSTLYNWRKDFIMKENNQLKPTIFQLCTNIKPNESWYHTFGTLKSIQKANASDNHKDVYSLSGLSVSYLKSILQKNIRRRRTVSSVRVALELAILDWTSLLRRICIIMIEDSILHPALPLLVWLMVVDSKYHTEFIVPPHIVQVVLFVVFEIANTSIHDDMMPLNFDYENNTEPFSDDMSHKLTRRFADSFDSSVVIPLSSSSTSSSSSSSSSFSSPSSSSSSLSSTSTSSSSSLSSAKVQNNDPICALLRSLVLRAEYGGMHGDVAMLYAKARLWRRRFQPQNQPTPPFEAISDDTSSCSSHHDLPKPFWYLSQDFIENSKSSSPWMSYIFNAHQPLRNQENGKEEVLMRCGNKMNLPSRKTSQFHQKHHLFKSLEKNDILYAGIDFHVYSNCCNQEIIKFMMNNSQYLLFKINAKLLMKYNENERKQAMWHCSSKLNYRKFLSSNNFEALLHLQSAEHQRIWELMSLPHQLLIQENLSSIINC